MLRGLSISLFVVGLVLFRRVLTHSKASPAIINLVLLSFILTPLVPFEAAQINYDNLLFPLAALSLLLALQVIERLRGGRFDSLRLLSLATVCMLASLVKYAFLPFFLGIVVWVAFEASKLMRARHIRVLKLLGNLWKDLKKTRRITQFVVVSCFLVSVGLFMQMYGYNILRYDTPAPECNAVLTTHQCASYGPWYRNFQLSNAHKNVDPNVFAFSAHWASNYSYSLISVVNGIYSGFSLGPALPVLYVAIQIIFWFGLLAVVWHVKKLWGQLALRLFIIVCGVFIATLWVQNYVDYLHTGQYIAQQGRYLLSLLLPIYVLVALAFFESIRNRTGAKIAAVCLLVLCLSQGGGVATYIIRSDAGWWWENNWLAYHINQTAQPLLQSFTIGDKAPDTSTTNPN